MNYAYYEVKTFLAAELYDTARHYDVFRTRALANGGTLGLESPGLINRRIIESRAGWTETAVVMYLLRGSFTLMLYRYGEAYPRRNDRIEAGPSVNQSCPTTPLCQAILRPNGANIVLQHYQVVSGNAGSQRLECPSKRKCAAPAKKVSL